MSFFKRMKFNAKWNSVASKIGCNTDVKKQNILDMFSIATVLYPDECGGKCIKVNKYTKCEAMLFIAYVNRLLLIFRIKDNDAAHDISDYYIERVQKAITGVYKITSYEPEYILLNRFHHYDTCWKRNQELNEILDALNFEFSHVFKHTYASKSLIPLENDMPVMILGDLTIDFETRYFCIAALDYFGQKIVNISNTANG